MKINTMRVLVVEPGRPAYIKSISRGLESLQKEVGGYIQAIYPFDDPVGLVCNDEGKLLGLPLNRALRDDHDKIYDVVAGTFLIVGLTDEDFTGLSEQFADKYYHMFRVPEKFIPHKGKIIVLREDLFE